MVMLMNKKGVTILELLISITMISVVILLLINVMFSLNKINNDDTYASNDEINRTEIIKNIESDFLNLKLNGLNIVENTNNTFIIFNYENESKKLLIEKNKITYNNESHTLNSENATYSLCLEYSYLELENNYYLITLTIPVLIDGENTTNNDDLVLTYLGLRNDLTSYLNNFTCKVY